MKNKFLLIGLFFFWTSISIAQITIKDVSPTFDNTNITQSPKTQSVSGKGLCISTSPDGTHVYLGGHSGVWRSFDSGLNWKFSGRPHPPQGQTFVPNALLVPNVYDLLVSPIDNKVVLAGTGNDIRSPSKDGIYRSTDGANSWRLVHQFDNNGSIGRVGCFSVAPDNPSLLFAAGQHAVGISNDGGISWTESRPAGLGFGTVYHVVAGPLVGRTGRDVYAVGNDVWHSQDGGINWQRDPTDLSLSFPADGPGISSRALAIHPTNPKVVYLIRNEANLAAVWKGDFSNGNAIWTLLPTIPINYPIVTASGGNYVIPHVTSNGQFYLIASDRRTVHISLGEPTSTSDWKRIDDGNPHVDPHGIALTAGFQYHADPMKSPASSSGKIYMVNDGGANVSTDGANNWTLGKGLSTLGLVNVAILPRPDKAPGICIGMGDNSGFFSPDDGENWKTQDYQGGDNDCTFSDPQQASRLLVFAPRSGNRRIFLYTKPGGVPDGAVGTSDRQSIPGPPPLAGETKAAWNAVSFFYARGYRPLILTLDGETPRPDGDFVTIRLTNTNAVLLRTTKMSQINNEQDWVTAATTESAGIKVFRQGPILPDRNVDVVQASGGHASPTFYVSDSNDGNRLWKWQSGMAQWQQIVPGSSPSGPTRAKRFFVDPFRPDLLYVLDTDRIYFSSDGGINWSVDTRLENALTENGNFPFTFSVSQNRNPGETLLREIIFDPVRPNYRFAVGPAGVFYTIDGSNWGHLFLTAAMPIRPNNAYYDIYSDPCVRALYVATSNCGLIKITGLPPESPHPVGSVLAVEGKITFLRVHDVGTGYGPPDDQLDTEVIVRLTSMPEKAFGFKLRKGQDELTHQGMLDQLRDAFNQDGKVRIEYRRTTCNTGEIIRVMNVF